MPPILSPYKRELFLSHGSWNALKRVLEGRSGGSYALSGVRGAGKSWMMNRATEWADAEDGLDD